MLLMILGSPVVAIERLRRMTTTKTTMTLLLLPVVDDVD
jgi:hypothetical protein